MKWEDQNKTLTPREEHHRVNLGPNCSGAILSHSDPMTGYFLTIRLDASTSVDATLAECKRDFLARMIPILEANLTDVKRKEHEP
jgi:hypothetical protein